MLTSRESECWLKGRWVKFTFQPQTLGNVLQTDQSVQQLAQWKGLLAGWLLEAVDAAPEPTANPESIRWLSRPPHSGQSIGASISEHRLSSVNSV